MSERTPEQVKVELLEAVTLAVLDLIDLADPEHTYLHNTTANNLRALLLEMQKTMP